MISVVIFMHLFCGDQLSSQLFHLKLLINKVISYQCGGGVIQLPSCVQLFATAWTAARQASLSFTLVAQMVKNPTSRQRQLKIYNMNLKDVFDKRYMKWFQTCFSVSISNLWMSRAVIASMSMGSHWLGRSTKDLSGLMKILCFLIWVWVSWVLTFGENIQPYSLDLCVSLYELYLNQKRRQKILWTEMLRQWFKFFFNYNEPSFVLSSVVSNFRSVKTKTIHY